MFDFVEYHSYHIFVAGEFVSSETQIDWAKGLNSNDLIRLPLNYCQPVK